MLAIALGTGAVVWVTCCYESVRQTLMTWAESYIGDSHLNIESPLGKYGQIAERVVEPLRSVSGVEHVTPRLVLRLRGAGLKRADLQNAPVAGRRWDAHTPEVDVHGIDLAHEFAFRQYELVAGRMLTARDEFACVLENTFAREEHLGVGDYLLLWGDVHPEPYALEVVGLVDRRRIAKFQKGLVLMRLPVMQEITGKQALVTTVDIRVSDPTRRGVLQVYGHVEPVVQRIAGNARVYSAATRLRQIENTHRQTDFVLVLLSCVAMLTALFIILTTLSMGMVERIAQLGLLRCVGMTGSQLAWVVLVEVLPLGILGILLGIPVGLGLTFLTAELVPEYVGEFPFRLSELQAAAGQGAGQFFSVLWSVLLRTGIVIAAGAGLLTTLVGAFVPATAALTVSPLQASRPRARRSGRWPLLIAFGLAAVTLAVQFNLLEQVHRSPKFLQSSAVVVVLLYVGYALLSPLVVRLIGRPAVVVTAAVLRVRPRLLQDQIGNAVWRSAGICCGLMVGLSLIVGLFVFNESFRAGWQFPKEFPAAYVWSMEPMRPDAQEVAENTPGILNATAANTVNVIVEEIPLFGAEVLRSVTWFMGMEPESFFALVHAEFIEGTEQDALRRLKEGNHIVVAADFSRARNKHLGDTVRIYFDRKPHEFQVAGVVDSPALDIAASYFQVQSEMGVAAHGSVMGTNEDLRRLIGVNATRLVLFNFDLPEQPPPADWPPPRGSPEAADMPGFCFDRDFSLAHRWQRWREELVLRDLQSRLDAPRANRGTASELKDQIDHELTTMTKLLTAVPAVALLVAAIGVANLMTTNVISRARQLAILRAVGATRGLILRMVIGEALVLGFLGSALGFGLGLHMAKNTGMMSERMWGFDLPFTVPWAYVLTAIALTVGLCMLAGILPARHASRTNVVDALHVP